MALDAVAIGMITDKVSNSNVLCLGYPEIANVQDSIGYLFSAGANTVDVVDVIQHKGMERLLDLNEPQVWPKRYQLVINPGTLEHCFNIAQAFKNAWDAVDIGGCILQISPVTMLNHGFWNLNPIAMSLWCEYNGGKMESMKFAENGTQKVISPEQIKSSGSGRGQLPPETVMYALCRKLVDVPTRWPVQGGYRR